MSVFLNMARVRAQPFADLLPRLRPLAHRESEALPILLQIVGAVGRMNKASVQFSAVPAFNKPASRRKPKTWLFPVAFGPQLCTVFMNVQRILSLFLNLFFIPFQERAKDAVQELLLSLSQVNAPELEVPLRELTSICDQYPALLTEKLVKEAR